MPIDIETPFVLSAVHAKARNLKAHNCFSDRDFEDIEADLLLHLWEVSLRLPSERFAEPSLIITILNRKGVDMLRHQKSKSEQARRKTKSLDAMIDVDEDGNPLTLMDTLPACSPRTVDEAVFQIDAAARLSALSNELRMIVGKMRQGYTHADIAREMNLSRDAFHRRYVTLIQKTIFPECYAKNRRIP